MVSVRVWTTRCGLAHTRADGRETDGEAGADGGERRDPHGAVLAKTNVSSYSEGALSVRILQGTFDAKISQHQHSSLFAICRPAFGIFFPTLLNPSSLQILLQVALPEPVSRLDHSTPASACAACGATSVMAPSVATGSGRHFCFATRFGSNTVSSAEPTRESACCVHKAVCSQATQGCCGGMRRGWGRSSTRCGHEGREERTLHHLPTRLMHQTDQVTSSLHQSSGLHRGPSRCKGAQHRSRRESGPSSVRFGCLGSVRFLRGSEGRTPQRNGIPEPPSAHPAHLQPRLLRSFGQRSGARRREKR